MKRRDASGGGNDPQSKGPFILVAVVFLLLAALWTAFILFAEEHKPESIPVHEAQGEGD